MSLELDLKNIICTNLISIDAEESLSSALRVMKEKGFRHLPVLKDGSPYSVVSEYDIGAILAIAENSQELLNKSISDFCALEAATISSNADMREVISILVREKLGAVIVRDGDNYRGIVSVIDILKEVLKMLDNSN